jgi:DNA-binding HxlR family transcriptional regulator
MDIDTSQILRSLGKAEAIAVLRVLRDGGYGFNEIKDEVKTDPKTLARRLDDFTELGIVEKKEDSNYHLTESGDKILALAERMESTLSSEVNEVA